MPTVRYDKNQHLDAIAESLTLPKMAKNAPAIDLEVMQRYRITPIKRMVNLTIATFMGLVLLAIPTVTIMYAADRLAAVNYVMENQHIPGDAPTINPRPDHSLKPVV